MENDARTIHMEEREGCVILTLDRPPLNVLNIPMMEEFNAALEKINTMSGLCALVLRGKGKAFSAGVDVGDHTADKVGHMVEVFHRIFHLLHDFPGVTIAAVEGAALGGGCEVACFCDVVLASERAKFGQPEIKVGVFPPLAATVFPTTMPYRTAFEMILSGDVWPADEALGKGFINRVAPADDFEAELEKEIGRYTALSAEVIRVAKKAIRSATMGALPFKETMERVETIYLDELMTTEDANEGLTAFLEKRRPSWKHK